LTKNYLYVVFYILMMFPVVMTYSKAAWLQYFLLYFLFGIRWNLFLLIFFILAVSLFASELYDVIGFKISQTASGSLSTRIDYFLYASVGSLYSPFLGHGSGSFFEINKYFNLNILPGNNSHNAFSEILFNYGFFAFFTFAFFFWCTIRRLFNVIYGSAMHPLFNFKFLIIISVFLIYPMVQLQVYSQPWFYALSGLMGGYYARPTAPSRA
jgi:O-antigen ligase